MEVISRKDAKKDELKWYFTGKPCKHGHIAKRYITKSECQACRLARYASKKSKYKRLNKQWKKRNKGLVNATAAKRNSAKLLRTVAWANLEKIKEIYKNCPKGMVVDHIIPLQGKLVSGLHVENNLQYLTPSENNRKSNKYNVA
jgi:hypothetical protein